MATLSDEIAVHVDATLRAQAARVESDLAQAMALQDSTRSTG